MAVTLERIGRKAAYLHDVLSAIYCHRAIGDSVLRGRRQRDYSPGALKLPCQVEFEDRCSVLFRISK